MLENFDVTYFESHITLESAYEKRATDVANAHGWKTSKINGDEVLGDVLSFYLTKSGPFFDILKQDMNDVIVDLEFNEIPWRRKKIEAIIEDVRKY